MERVVADRKDIQAKRQAIKNAKQFQCFFCQLKELPDWKSGKHFIKICDLCQKKLEMLNQFARP